MGGWPSSQSQGPQQEQTPSPQVITGPGAAYDQPPMDAWQLVTEGEGGERCDRQPPGLVADGPSERSTAGTKASAAEGGGAHLYSEGGIDAGHHLPHLADQSQAGSGVADLDMKGPSMLPPSCKPHPRSLLAVRQILDALALTVPMPALPSSGGTLNRATLGRNIGWRYDARSRSALFRTASILGVPPGTMYRIFLDISLGCVA